MVFQTSRGISRRPGIASPPRSRAFFFELLFNMLIFALCAAVVLQVFVEGKLLTDQSYAMTELDLRASTLAAEYKSAGGQLSELKHDESQGLMSTQGVVSYFYDRELQNTTPEQARYTLVLTPLSEQGEPVSVVRIEGFEEEVQLFSFEVSHYEPPEGR